MNDYFRALRSGNPKKELLSVTVLSGEKQGEKMLICDGEAIFRSPDFPSIDRETLSELKESGVTKLGGEDVYVERPGRRKKLVICGCGHVAIPIIKIAKLLDFYVTAIDDRKEFTGNALKAGADKVICDSFDKALKGIEGDIFTFFVIVTRGHSFDEVCVEAIKDKASAYIGMMGSRRRQKIVRQNLINMGIKEEFIDLIHTPIGLDIGSETPEEIAVSVFAEIIKIKNGKVEQILPEDILDAMEGEDDKILATIVSRKGSAPRSIGAKILIRGNAPSVNTIGGGLMESTITKRAEEMLSDPSERFSMLHIELNADEDSRVGEVCGGILDVMLERV